MNRFVEKLHKNKPMNANPQKLSSLKFVKKDAFTFLTSVLLTFSFSFELFIFDRSCFVSLKLRRSEFVESQFVSWYEMHLKIGEYIWEPCFNDNTVSFPERSTIKNVRSRWTRNCLSSLVEAATLLSATFRKRSKAKSLKAGAATLRQCSGRIYEEDRTLTKPAVKRRFEILTKYLKVANRLLNSNICVWFPRHFDRNFARNTACYSPACWDVNFSVERTWNYVLWSKACFYACLKQDRICSFKNSMGFCCLSWT